MNEPANAAHLHWGAEGLWQRLLPVLPGLSVEVLARIDSTNTRLIDRARRAAGDLDAPVTRPGALDPLERTPPTPHGRRAGDMQPCLLVAEQQQRGRGRHGRGWIAEAGASLTFSLALPLAPRDWSGLSLAVGLALAEALDPAPAAGAARIGLKWPNDLWLLAPGASAADAAATGAKLGGILIETVSVGTRRMCVVGVGLNVRPLLGAGAPTTAAEASAAGIASSFSSGFACLQQLAPHWNAPGALATVAEPLARALLAFEREGFAPLAQRYAMRDLLRGQAVSTSTDFAASGVAEGVDAMGALLVRTEGPGGALQRIVSGEVTVRMGGPAAAGPTGAR